MTKSSAPSYARSVGKHRLAASALLLASALYAAPGPAASPIVAPSLDAPDIGERVAAISALGPRAEGSEGEAAAFAYIERELKAAGLEPSARGFSDADANFSNSRIVEARAKGAREDELAVIVPVSTWVDSPARSPKSAEGAYGIALALDEAARLSAEVRAGAVCPISLRFVFLGAEKRGRASDHAVSALGSSAWIARQEGRTRLAVLYLSMDDVPARVTARGAGSGVIAPYWYYEGTGRALEGSGIAYGIETNRLQAYRLALASDYGPAAPYLEAGIPAIELRGEMAAGEAAMGEPAASWFATFVGAFANQERGGFADTWDRHYFIFQLAKLSVALREGSYVAFLVIAFALVASSFLIATVARRSASRRLLRRVPVIAAEILALFAALALVFIAGKGIAWLDAAALGSAEAWRLSPRIFAAARILFSFLLFLSMLSYLVEKRILTPNPYFYEFAALVCLAIDSLVFSAVDLSASFYFIWALVFVELSLAARRRWVTLLAYALMYLPLLVIAAELAARPELSTFGKLIAPEYLGVLALSALTLPFFAFTASPLLFFARPGAAARKRAVFFFAACAIAVEVLALAYAGLSAPLSGPRRKDLAVSEAIDQDAGEFQLELSGRRRLGKGYIERGGARLEYDSLGDRAYLKGADNEVRIGMTEKSSPFLDRVDESVAIRFATRPYRVDIALESEAAMLIYDCNLPYKVAVDGKSAIIYSGVNPGPELDLSLTVPASFRSRLVVTSRYLSSLDAYAQSSLSPLADNGLSVRASFSIGSGPK